MTELEKVVYALQGSGYSLADVKSCWRDILKRDLMGEIEADDSFVILSTSEHEELLADSEFLACLEACGVDNWEGYSDAAEMLEEEE